MTRRLVVCLRWRPDDSGPSSAVSFASAAQEVVERMSALGGRLVLWHAEWLALDFSAEGLQDAIDFLIDKPRQRFSIGFACGPVTELLDGGPMLAACVGPTIERAVALARMARAGEVLVEPALVKATAGELLVQGARAATIGGERVRGLRLDLSHPQRSLECESIARLARTAFESDRAPELEVRNGALSLVIAVLGAGGSRFIQELRFRQDAPCLLFRGLGAIEPQAVLARGLCSVGFEPAELDPVMRQAHESLMKGNGLPAATAAKLLAATVKKGQLKPILYLDDVHGMDADSVEALALACSEHGLALVACATSEQNLPLSLARLPRAVSVNLPDLKLEQAVSMLKTAARDELSKDWAEWLATRGMPHPLGVHESLLEALDTASFLWTSRGIVPRVARREVAERQTAALLMRRRLHLVEMTDRLILDVIAILGGCTTVAVINVVLKLAGCDPSAVDNSLRYLKRGGWVDLGSGAQVALTTRTAHAVIVGTLSKTRFKALHQAASTQAVESGRPLALVRAAVHAFLAGNVGKAGLVAARAAAHARKVGLEETAATMERFQKTTEADVFSERIAAGPTHHQQKTISEQFPEVDGALKAAADDNLRSRTLPAEAPRPAGEAQPASQHASESDKAASLQHRTAEFGSAGSGESARRADLRREPTSSSPTPVSAADSVDGVSETDVEGMSADDIQALVPSEEPEGDVRAASPVPRAANTPMVGGDGKGTSPTLRVHHLPSDAESLMPARAGEALRRGDPVTLDELARQLRSEAHTVLADRLDAMASLVRGDVGEALRRLRVAKQQVAPMSASERCRASLALSVAVAAAGRPNDALFEVLEGLAQARRGGDARGQRACAKFLAQLAQRAGHFEVAKSWQALSSSLAGA